MICVSGIFSPGFVLKYCFPVSIMSGMRSVPWKILSRSLSSVIIS